MKTKKKLTITRQSKKKYAVEINELKFNKAIEINYKHDLLVLKRQMVKEYNSCLIKFYKDNLLFLVGDSDDDTIKRLQRLIDNMGRRWQDRYDRMSEAQAKKVAVGVLRHVDNRWKGIQKGNPFLLKGTQELQQTTKIVQAGIAENVGLIKSIPSKYHEQILGDVMRTVGVGGNVQKLQEALSKISNQTSKRIGLIARDQTAKATALIDRQNAIDTGFTTAVWQKSIAGKTHRADHAAADGDEFDISKGCLISGEYILPRMKINCKCSYKLVIKFDEE